MFPLEQTRHVGVAKSKHPKLTNGDTDRRTDGRTDGQTDRQTDRQTTCDRNTALCTAVHRAVKTVEVRIMKFSPYGSLAPSL